MTGFDWVTVWVLLASPTHRPGAASRCRGGGILGPPWAWVSIPCPVGAREFWAPRLSYLGPRRLVILVQGPASLLLVS